ncbi:hypothetical protein Mapa_014709 [Marchantia paleacea]|nr:hypothetical protein Mapa_014709 [Marchantia paleacea]
MAKVVVTVNKMIMPYTEGIFICPHVRNNHKTRATFDGLNKISPDALRGGTRVRISSSPISSGCASSTPKAVK